MNTMNKLMGGIWITTCTYNW